jgi:putative Mg2+ transporter-C (MgtC) family protein
VDINLIDNLLRIIFALIIGGLIGIEREIKNKPAGMRTNMLMCMGSCLIMILSVEVARQKGMPADPGRIASQVVTGVGFIGAGTIIRSRASISGLTSAATIWLVAALGLVIGTGNFILAGATAVLIIIVLSLLRIAENRLAVRQSRHLIQFQFSASTERMKIVKRILRDFHITPENITLSREGRLIFFDIEYVTSDKQHQDLIEVMSAVDGVEIVLDF